MEEQDRAAVIRFCYWPLDELSARNLRRVRPGHGLPPKYYNILLGRRVTKAVKKGTPVSWGLIQ